MRVEIYTKSVTAGDKVIITCRTTDNCKYARFYLFSSVDGDEFSPHSFAFNPDNVSATPVMYGVVSKMVHSIKPFGLIRFTVEQDMVLKVMQEKDLIKDPNAVARIYVHGKAYKTRRWFLRNIVRRTGRFCSRFFVGNKRKDALVRI